VGKEASHLLRRILRVFWEEKEEDECVRENLVLMCEKGWFMEKMYANKEHGRKLCIANSYSGVHGRMSMTKPLDSYLKYFFLSNPLLDLSQTFNSFNLGGVKCFCKISGSLGLLQGSYTYRK
jgi:hypothetical protein